MLSMAQYVGKCFCKPFSSFRIYNACPSSKSGGAKNTFSATKAMLPSCVFTVFPTCPF